ncbi:hypothetical protein KPSA1_03448 [Pseudomonas syringae pv. actinidiae]|uniref:Uncharacterized protein n=1 Tax=Pseudomonas syringae pv. actinidiae TaxID=103796 RepID=A0A2V0QAN2_PSESF|nr:hypothetical protein KPSA1_03448 [Pseudomonas syringae pv. actinidiae]
MRLGSNPVDHAFRKQTSTVYRFYSGRDRIIKKDA